MAIDKKRTIDFLENEWATYVARFERLPADEKSRRMNEQGYKQFRDMLAHILAWWDEGMTIIKAVAESREVERKKYDFDVFNAAAIEKYKDWDEAEFMAHFEKTRQKALADFKSMNEADFEHRRVQAWIHAVFIHHAREHLAALSKFLALDTLENEWASYLAEFDASENKDEFLQKQGFERFGGLLAHVIGWWDEGIRIAQGAMNDPAFVYKEPDTDAFNAELVEACKDMDEAELRKRFEKKRIEMVDFVRSLPKSALQNPTIEEWLAADVVEHFDEHAL